MLKSTLRPKLELKLKLKLRLKLKLKSMLKLKLKLMLRLKRKLRKPNSKAKPDTTGNRFSSMTGGTAPKWPESKILKQILKPAVMTVMFA